MPQTDRLNPIAKELMRYHNSVGYLSMSPDNPLLAEDAQAQALLRQLKYWQEHKPHERGNPPHIVAGIRLNVVIRKDVDLALDAMPEMARRLQQSFDELFEVTFDIEECYRAGRDSYDESLGKAFWLALRAETLAERVDAYAQSQAGQATITDRIEPRQDAGGSKADQENEPDEKRIKPQQISNATVPDEAATQHDTEEELSLAAPKKVIADALGLEPREFDKQYKESLKKISNKKWRARRDSFSDTDWKAIIKSIDNSISTRKRNIEERKRKRAENNARR